MTETFKAEINLAQLHSLVKLAEQAKAHHGVIDDTRVSVVLGFTDDRMGFTVGAKLND